MPLKKTVFCTLALLICSPLLWSQPVGGNGPAGQGATSSSPVVQMLQPSLAAAEASTAPLTAVRRSWQSVKTMFR
ncbi:hypothetical protein LRS06_13300 [Hymenobacter sp. J193]|uniref:hypothetical protein n=1 Tax=Hymenobacter sp. J193 TaxID=2898429 RepID=UPI002150E5C0|nr:hypothetical protein [Hymenobacter sp. J193]MCR5888725.1 hypothetical protein [Hymenobacter sp. J193]